MGEDKKKESIDQPNKKESEDQPDSESLEGEESDEETEEIPEEESEESEEDLIEIDGQKLTVEELKKGYMRTSDYTRKTSELAREKERLEMLRQKPNSTLSPEQQEVLNSLKSLGLTTRDELEITIRRMMAQQELMSEKNRVQQDTGLDDDLMYAAQALSLRKNITLSEAAQTLIGRKPIPKKAIAVKGGVGKTVIKEGEKVTPEYVASLNLDDPKDKKEFEKIQKAMEAGEL